MKEMIMGNVIAPMEAIKCVSQAANEMSFIQRLIILIIGCIAIVVMLRIVVNKHYENELTKAYIKLGRVENEKKEIEKRMEKINESIKEKNAEISMLKEEMKKKDEMITKYEEKVRKLKDITEYVIKLREEKEKLQIMLTEKEEEINRIREVIPYTNEEYYGDLSYWTGKRLYDLKQRFPKMSYRKMEEITGISKSTIQKRVSKYMKQMDRE